MKRISFSLKEKDSVTKARQARFMRYAGPDSETLRLLKQYAGIWSNNPEYFWTGGHRQENQAVTGMMDAQVQIVSLFLDFEREDS